MRERGERSSHYTLRCTSPLTPKYPAPSEMTPPSSLESDVSLIRRPVCERVWSACSWSLQPQLRCLLPSLGRAAWTSFYNHYQSLWQSSPPPHSPPPPPSAPGFLSVVINGTRAPARLTLPVPAMFPWYLMNSDKLLFPCSVVPFTLHHPAPLCLKCTTQSWHCGTLGLALVLCKFLSRPTSKNKAPQPLKCQDL